MSTPTACSHLPNIQRDPFTEMILTSEKKIFQSIEDDLSLRADKWNLSSRVAHKMIWRYSSENDHLIPSKGFKLHLSATQFNCVDILDLVAPILLEGKIPFKCVGSVDLLIKLNYGIFGYSQVGKFITIYPFNPQHAVELALTLNLKTQPYRAPKVPSDRQLAPFSIIHYRYGSLHDLNEEGTHSQHDVDSRHPAKSIPVGIDDPFLSKYPQQEAIVSRKHSLFAGKYLFLETLQQKAKGGVYRGLKFESLSSHADRCSTAYPQKVIIKEARYLTDIDKKGIDAVMRLKNQEQLQLKFHLLELAPKNIESFEVDGNYYLVMNDLGYETLQSVINNKRPIPTSAFLSIVRKIINKMLTINSFGYFAFDASLNNFILKDGTPYVIDLEYASSLDDSYQLDSEYGTPGFYPRTHAIESSNLDPSKLMLIRDMFGIGAILLSFFQREWLDSLKTKEPFTDQNWGMIPYVKTLPNEIKRIIQKLLLLSNPYSHWKELDHDLSILRKGRCNER